MKTFLQLLAEVYTDLTIVTDIGNLQHLELVLSPFPGLGDDGEARFLVYIPMKAPAFYAWGAQMFSIIVPMYAPGNRTDLGESASVVEIAPLRYGSALFDSPADKLGDTGFVHPMLQGDQVVRFSYPAQMNDFHQWIVAFYECTRVIEGGDGDCNVR
tara:strand:- start:1950 stop:2420 length:471 start_codon:yes stop_codon:yes gene_type:complete